MLCSPLCSRRKRTRKTEATTLVYHGACHSIVVNISYKYDIHTTAQSPWYHTDLAAEKTRPDNVLIVLTRLPLTFFPIGNGGFALRNRLVV